MSEQAATQDEAAAKAAQEEAQAEMERAIRAIRTFRAEVLRVSPLTPAMVRITIGGGDLPGFARIGLDDFVYVFFPKPGERETTVDPTFTWDFWRSQPESERAVGRYYTVRAHRPEANEIDLDIVIHEAGPGAAWAASAEPGQVVALWGPRKAYDPDPAAEWQLLYADETGLPATLTICEGAPAGTVIHAFVEIAGPQEEQPVSGAADVHLHWVHRAPGEHAGASDALLRAIRATELPAGRVYAWGAAESGVLEGIRAYLVNERGVEAACIRNVGYWQYGKSKT